MSIILTELSKRYGKTLVVNNVSLTVDNGEFFVLLGPSGSGKSTILRMIAGLTLPDEGKVELNGKDVTSWPPQQRGAGFVFQNYSLFRHMNVADNIEFGLKVRKVAPADILSSTSQQTWSRYSSERMPSGKPTSRSRDLISSICSLESAIA